MVLTRKQISSLRASPSEQKKGILQAYLSNKGIQNTSKMTKPELVEYVRLLDKTRANVLKKNDAQNMRVGRDETKISIIRRMARGKIKRKEQLKKQERDGFKEANVWKFHDYAGVMRYRFAWARNGQGSPEGMYDVLSKWLDENPKERLRHIVFYLFSKNATYHAPIRYMTVQASDIDMDTERDFVESINALMGNDGDVGSDIVNNQNEVIDFSKFDISATPRRELNGNGMTIYKSMGIDGGKKGLCVVKCLKELLDIEYSKKDVSYVEDLRQICREKNIDLLLSTIRFNGSIFKEDPAKKLKLPSKEHPKRKICLYPMDKKKARPLYMIKHENPVGTILIDYENNHADVIKGVVEYNNVYFGGDKLFIVSDDLTDYEEIKNYNMRTIVTENMHLLKGCHAYHDEEGNVTKVNAHPGYRGIIVEGHGTSSEDKAVMKIEFMRHEYVMIDYETVCDFSDENVLIPISLQYHILDHLPKGVMPRDMNYSHVNIAYGRDCTKAIVDMITSEDAINKKYTFVTYNGSRFDHYILYREMMRLMPDCVGSEFFVKNELLSFKINDIHDVFDLYKHLHLSLKDACDGFKIDAQKGEIDFYDIQEKYDNMEKKDFEKYLENDEDFNKYAKMDIVCLTQLFKTYTLLLEHMGGGMFEHYSKNLSNNLTYGGMMKKVFASHVAKKGIKIPTITDEKLFNDIKKSSTGGRVQLFCESDKIDERIASLDMSGCYTYCMAVMQDAWYGSGKIIECEKYEDMPPDKIGFFYCTNVNQSKAKVKIIPKKGKNENIWDTKEIIDEETLLSTVVIDDLKKAKCTLTIGKGIYFSERVKGCELFGFLLNLMKEKSIQDTYNEQGNKLYNPALRMILKSFMLILSGKLAEGLYLKQTRVMNAEQFKTAELLDENVELLNSIEGKIICNIPVDTKTALKKSKPIYLSTLIYDYSHRYMSGLYNMFSYKKLICTSTDSLKVRHSDFVKVQKKMLATPLPHWEEVEEYDPRYKTAKMLAMTSNEKVIGSFVDEYATNDYKYGIFFKKGCYYLSGEKDKNITYSGLCPKDIPINNIEEFKDMSPKELNDYYNSNKKINEDPDKFFNDYYEKGVAHVLCQSIRRNKKTMHLYQRTTAKELTF
jgi:hypothetical protein